VQLADGYWALVQKLNLAWKAWRRDGIGGSDVSAILGLSPYVDPPHNRETVFAEKAHGIEREANFAMNRGTRLEPVARLAYTKRHRCTALPTCVEMDGCPWARVSLDGLCTDGAAINRLWWILELKCPNWMTHDLALSGIVAEHFMVQCQWQLLVCGLDRLDFASFNPGQRFTPSTAMTFERWLTMPESLRPPMPPEWLAEVAVQADPDQQAWILQEAGKFWFEVLEARAAFDHEAGEPTAPPRDTSRFEAEAI
jgi:putative phage-type endonuclease